MGDVEVNLSSSHECSTPVVIACVLAVHVLLYTREVVFCPLEVVCQEGFGIGIYLGYSPSDPAAAPAVEVRFCHDQRSAKLTREKEQTWL